MRPLWAWLVGIVLSLALLGLFWVVAGYQTTSPAIAQRILRRAIATLGEVDALWPSAYQQLVEAAEQESATPLSIPDFPVQVTLSPQDVLNLPSPQLKELALEKAAARVYEEGTEAFIENDEVSRELDLFSPQGAVNRGLSLLTRDSHENLRLPLIALGALSLLLALLLLVLTRSYGRLAALGAAVTVAALTSTMAATALRFALRTAADEADDYAIADLLTVGKEMVEIPLRSGIILSLLGLGLLTLGLGLALLPKRLLPDSID